MRTGGAFRPTSLLNADAFLRAMLAELKAASVVAPSIEKDSVSFGRATIRTWPAFPIFIQRGRIEVVPDHLGLLIKYEADAPFLASAGLYLFMGSVAISATLAVSGLALWSLLALPAYGVLLRASIASSTAIWLEELCSKAQRRVQSTTPGSAENAT